MGTTEHYDVLLKVLLVGDSGVGKTSILASFTEDGAFSNSFTPTFGIDFRVRTLEVEGRRVKLQLWDTAGQERFQGITSCYYRGASAVLIVYDITQAATFANLARWVRSVEELASPGVRVVLVGNKADAAARRQVTREEGEGRARRGGMAFMETSARSGANIQEVFHRLAEAVLEQGAGEERGPAEVIPLHPPPGGRRGCSCSR